MIISHNLMAMNAQRQFNIVGDAKKKSTEKLSSGYRINRAADDAAGLAISEKMRRQIRGLTQGANNIQDGISLVQVADGALNETQDILQRMNELAVKAANGTNTAEDRQYINQEVQQLIAEVDRIANATSFNDNVYPLLGLLETDSIGDTNSIEHQDNSIKVKTVSLSINYPIEVDGIYRNRGEIVPVTGFTTNGTEIVFDGGSAWVDSDTGLWSSSPYYPGDKWFSNDFGVLNEDSDGYMYYISKCDGDYFYLARDPNTTTSDPLLNAPKDYILRHSDWNLVTKDELSILNNRNDNQNKHQSNKAGLWIQAGSEPNVGFDLYMVDATASELGIRDIDVSNAKSAESAIESIKSALTKVGNYRSYFGAMQNRMEHAYNSNMNVVENTQDAESRIRDTDIAKEMVANSVQNILEQAGISMISQANQTNQGVLTLL